MDHDDAQARRNVVEIVDRLTQLGVLQRSGLEKEFYALREKAK